MQAKIQRTFSIQEEDSINPHSNHTENFIENTVQAIFKNRPKLPLSIQASLKNSKEPPSNLTQSKLSSMFKSKIKDIKNVTNCQICENEMRKEQKLFISNCQHKENFCESCLHHYAIYKIKTFEEVRCPHENCDALLDTSADFFKQLPADVQKTYKKIHQFYFTANDPNVKLCPKENCEGLIRTALLGVMVCDKCEAQFCSKCLLGKHQGECEKQELVFFEQQLHYRQCKKCKVVIEKNQGCNHMTCRCHYQFCYVCGSDWSPQHYGEHDQNGNIIANGGPTVAINNAVIEPVCDCSCCIELCGQKLACIFIALFKIILMLFFLIFMLLVFIIKDLVLLIGAIIFCFLLGAFVFSIEKIMQLGGWFYLIGVLIFPFFMFVGIVIAFKQVFHSFASDLCRQYWQQLCNGCSSIMAT